MKGKCEHCFIDVRVVCQLPEKYGEDCIDPENCEDYQESES